MNRSETVYRPASFDSGALSATIANKSGSQIARAAMINGVFSVVSPFGANGSKLFVASVAARGGLNSLSSNVINQVTQASFDGSFQNLSYGSAAVSALGGTVFGAAYGNTDPMKIGFDVGGTMIQSGGKGIAGGLVGGAFGTVTAF